MVFLRRYYHSGQIRSLLGNVDRLFEDCLVPKGEDGSCGAILGWAPAVDIFETEDILMIKADLPGLNKDDVQVEVENNILTIRGEKKEEHEVKEENYYRQERSYGSFQRVFQLPRTVKADGINASFKNGVLEVTLPKVEAAKPKKIEVKVG
ncbi:MAG: Hsp20/alpha crystallin family protein [bacterium]